MVYDVRLEHLSQDVRDFFRGTGLQVDTQKQLAVPDGWAVYVFGTEQQIRDWMLNMVPFDVAMKVVERHLTNEEEYAAARMMGEHIGRATLLSIGQRILREAGKHD